MCAIPETVGEYQILAENIFIAWDGDRFPEKFFREWFDGLGNFAGRLFVVACYFP